MTIIRTYSELIMIPTFIDRFKYLNLYGVVGEDTFGYDRYLNQIFYRSQEWRDCRRQIIIRDNGNDLACEGFEIFGKIIIHHMNPITVEDIVNRNPVVFDPEYLIATSDNTHLAIHYGSEELLITEPIVRTKNDTCPWRK